MLQTTNRKIETISPHPGQQRILASEARFRVVACGRRFGKTEVGKLDVLTHALSGQICWWLAPTYSMASEVWRGLKLSLRALPGVDIRESERRIALPGGGLLAIRSTHNPANLRGAGLDFAVLDEAAFMEPDVWPEVVRPMLLERRGAALFLSTPYGRNWFWHLFADGLDPTAPEWAAFHFTSADNPFVDPAELAEIRRTTPERVYRAEYLAEFIEDAGAVFRGVDDGASERVDPEPVPGRRYVAGVDWGRDHDFTVMTVVDAEVGQVVAIDRFNGVGWELQRGRLAELCARWGPAVVWAEANSIGSVNIEALQAEGLPVRPFTTTARSKPPLIEGLALAIERGEIVLMPDPVLLHELKSYTLERLPGGGYRYSAPVGGHDDTVISLALAWHGASQPGTVISFI